MIKAVLFDIFGVLYPDTFWAIVNKHVPDAGLRQAEFSDLLKQNNLGHMAGDAFWDEAARIIGVSRSDIDRDLETFRDCDRELMAYVAELRGRHYRTGIISNIGHGFIDQVFTGFDTGDYFDVMILSSDVGYVKPDPMIYGLAAERLDLLPQECVFTDDREGHVQGAVAAGMQGILYKTLSQLKAELEPLLTDADHETALSAH